MKDHQTITRARIREMLRSRSLDRVASDLDMDPEEIERIAAISGGVMLRCNDTGRQWRATGWRGAYRQVCMIGLTDWDWWPAGGCAPC